MSWCGASSCHVRPTDRSLLQVVRQKLRENHPVVCRIHPDETYSNEESAFHHCGICKHPVYDPIKPSRKPFWVCVSVIQGIFIILGIYLSQPDQMIKSGYESVSEVWIVVSIPIVGFFLIAGLYFGFAIIPREKASAEWLSWALENGYKEDIN